MRQKELDALLTYLFPIAKEKLASDGEFSPIGGVIQANGDLKVFTTEVESEDVVAEAVVETLFEQFCQMAIAGEIKAAAACFNALVDGNNGTKPMPAIIVRCEDVDDAIDVFQTYELNDDDELVFGPLSGGPGRARVFAKAS